MEMKTLQCQAHGGEFQVPRKAGRPPRNCSAENPCDMNPEAKPRTRKVGATAKAATGAREARKVGATAADKRSTARKSTRPAKTRTAATKRQEPRTEEAKPATKSRPAASDVVVRHNPSVVMAKRAKDQLEPQGWNLKGRAWVDEAEDAWSEVTATRGEESLRLVWKNGEFESQDYSLWDSDKTPGQQPHSAKPKSRLPFDPNEMTDDELARELGGRTVTWWNRLAGSSETAVIGDKLKIEHAYTGGNETSRQIHFVDKTPNHPAFRSFNVDALMRVK